MTLHGFFQQYSKAALAFSGGTDSAYLLHAARAAGAGKVIAVWEQGLPSPLNDEAQVDGVYHDFSEWKKIFAELGLINK